MDFINLSDTGLTIATRQEIYEQLCSFARVAYGDDISLDEGTPFEVFIGMLADSLSLVNGATQSMSELLSSKELSGNLLDFMVSQRGIVRKTKKNQRVIMTLVVKDSIERPYIRPAGDIYVKDCAGRIWVNTNQLLVQRFKFLPNGSASDVENYQGTCEFGLTTNGGLLGYDVALLYTNNTIKWEGEGESPYEDGKPLVVVNSQGEELVDDNPFDYVMNYVNANAPILDTETDAQLRARFDNAVYSSTTSTVEALRANLLKYVNYVRIVQNLTDKNDRNDITNPYAIAGHSIWVIVDGRSTAENYVPCTGGAVSSDASDVTIAEMILNYKSLGCGVSVSPDVTPSDPIEIGDDKYSRNGNFMVEIPMDTLTAQIPFTRLVENKVKFEVVLSTTRIDAELRNSVRQQVLSELQSYVESLEPGDVITTVDIVNAIHNTLSKYEIGEFDYVSHNVSYAIPTKIEIYQRATYDSESSCKFNGEV